ncbi:MAG: extracellular solute-binding protein [Candidatus Omnitrophica bacterium]|nr:extracellular solute-binding protein [Candidatus Omnitrophota bacterium]
MKVLSRFGLVVFLFFCVMGLLAGCAPKQESGQCVAASINVWHWMTDREPAFKELAKRYEQKTGVKVNFELYAPSDAYTQKVRAAAQGANLPDIFGILGEKRDFASFVKAGFILDLTGQMGNGPSSWKERFFAKALAVNEFTPGNAYGVAPGIYGVPIDITTIQMLYNKDLFKRMGLDPEKPPATFEEFLNIGKKIKEAGLQGMVSGWGELWMMDCLANNYAFNIMGKDKVIATIKGEVPYTDPDWIRVFDLFRQMQESGVLYQGVVTMVNKTAEQLFANGKAVFAFNGSWCVNVYKGMNPDLKYAALLPPKASDKYPMAIWGGAGSSFMVNAKSRTREEAVKFLQWLTEKEQQAFLSNATFNLPANREALKDIPTILAQFADDMDATTHPSTWGISEFPTVIEAIDKKLQSIVIGESTPEQVAKEVQEIKARELAKKRPNR